MLDLAVKCLPIFLALIPFFVWLDRSKRFAHRRKFYLNRLEAVKEYLDNYYHSDKAKLEKDCAAQALVCSEKTSHLEVDYVIKEFPQRFFMMTKKLIAARHFIEASFEGNEIILTARSSKKSYKNKRLLLIGAYMSSIVIIPINNILIFISNKYSLFTPFEIDSWLIVVGGFGTLILGTGIAIISGLLFVGVDAAIEIYDDLKVRHVPRNSDS